MLFYGVKTTGIFCRIGCPSRKPRPENVVYFANVSEARAAGFRACLRCHPDTGPSERSRLDSVLARVCRHIERATHTPKLEELGELAGLSPAHLQRVFKEAVGVSPRVYAEAVRRRRLQRALRGGASATDAVYEAGFGSSSRVYERTNALLGMTPRRYGDGGAGETIRYASVHTELGWVLVARAQRGVCAIEIGSQPATLERALAQRFARATLVRDESGLQRCLDAVARFLGEPTRKLSLPLDLRGTAFQARVWQALQQIPAGETRSYAVLAASIGSARGARAVARACAQNPVALAVPCHRVVGTDSSLRGYRWGIERKRWLLEREAERARRK